MVCIGSLVFAGASAAFPPMPARESGPRVELTASANAVARGTFLTFTATVTEDRGRPVRLVRFFDGDAELKEVALNGRGEATFSTNNLTPGTHTITAICQGNPRYTVAASAHVIVTVSKSSPEGSPAQADATAQHEPAAGTAAKGEARARSGLPAASSASIQAAQAPSPLCLAAWGDSLTQGWKGALDKGAWTSDIQAQIGTCVVDLGMSGETSTQVGVRQGSVGTHITSTSGDLPECVFLPCRGITVTWPAGYEPTISINNNPYVPQLNVTGTLLTAPPVHGTVTFDGSAYTFAPDAQTALPVHVSGTEVFVVDRAYAAYAQTFWAGTDNYQYPQQVKSDLASMVASMTGLASVSVTAGGSYNSPPRVGFSGGGCSTPPSAQSVLTHGAVSAVLLTATGSGCANPPAVQFFGGGGSGAAATTTLVAAPFLVMGVINRNLCPENTYAYCSTSGSDQWPGSASGIFNEIAAINSSSAARYGTHFLDVRQLLVNAYNPLLPSDVADHNNGEPPTSLRAVLYSGQLTGPANASDTDCSAKGIAFAAEANNPPVGSIFTLDAGVSGLSENVLILACSNTSGYNKLCISPITRCVRGWGSNGKGIFSHSAGAPAQANDGVHFNAEGNQIIANAVAAALPPWVRLDSSVRSSPYGQPIRFTATITGNGTRPTGNLTFYDGTRVLGTVSVDATGTAAESTPVLPAGDHSITAFYLGDAANLPKASAPLIISVLPPRQKGVKP